MDCSQSVKYLHGLIDDELSEEEQEELSAHLQNCAACRKKLKVEKKFRMIVIKKTKVVKAPQELRKKIRTVIF